MSDHSEGAGVMHDCPDCMSACYCGGDIDDMLMEGTKEEQACTHCSAPDDDPDDEYFFEQVVT